MSNELENPIVEATKQRKQHLKANEYQKNERDRINRAQVAYQPRDKCCGCTCGWAERRKAWNRLLLAELVVEAIASVIVVALVIVSDSQEELRSRSLIFCVSLLAAVVSGSYGLYASDRGWIMVCFITQMFILASVTLFTMDLLETLRAAERFCAFELGNSATICGDQQTLNMFQCIVAILVFVDGVLCAWTSFRLEERIQEDLADLDVQAGGDAVLPPSELSEGSRTERNRQSGHCVRILTTCDLPYQSVKSLARWLYVFGALELVCDLAFLVLFILSAAGTGGVGSTSENTAYLLLIVLSLTFAMLTATYGARKRDRGFLMLSFILHLWWLSMVMSYIYDGWTERKIIRAYCSKAQVGAECAGSQLIGDLQWILNVVVFFITLVAAWLCLRLSERIQEMRIGAKLPWRCLGFDVGLWDSSLSTLSKVFSVLLTVSMVLVVCLLVVVLLTASFQTRLHDSLMAIAHLIVVVLGFYGLKYRNRVTLMGHLVIQTWILQASFRYFYRGILKAQTNASLCRIPEMSCGGRQELTIVDVGLMLIVFIIGLSESWVSMAVSEKIEDTEVTGKRQKSWKYVNKVVMSAKVRKALNDAESDGCIIENSTKTGSSTMSTSADPSILLLTSSADTGAGVSSSTAGVPLYSTAYDDQYTAAASGSTTSSSASSSAAPSASSAGSAQEYMW